MFGLLYGLIEGSTNASASGAFSSIQQLGAGRLAWLVSVGGPGTPSGGGTHDEVSTGQTGSVNEIGLPVAWA